MSALAMANEVRSARAKIKRDLDADYGREDELCRLILDPPEYLEKVTVMEALTWPKGWGENRARVTLDSAGLRLSKGRTLGGLTTGEREELTSAILARGRSRRVLTDPDGNRWMARPDGADLRLELLEGDHLTGVLSYTKPAKVQDWTVSAQ